MKIRTTIVAETVLALIGLAGMCSAQATSSAAAASPMITGTVTYRVRMALPPEAAIDIRLEDVSRADAPATLVAENIFAAAGKQVPISFQLPYSQKDIQPDHRYQVRARITVEEKLIFTTATAYRVITNGAPTQVNLLLQPVSSTHTGTQSGGAAGETASGKTTASLRGTVWLLTELNGLPPVAPMDNNAGQLLIDTADNRFSGSTGCNRMTGTFEQHGGSLHFKPAATTMMACPEPVMKQEQAFTATLQSVTAYGIKGGNLELSAGDKVVARFKAETAKSLSK